MPDYLFISYKSEEKPFTIKLANDLRNLGIEVWVDHLDGGIEIGDRWQQKLDTALKNCQGMIVIITPEYFSSNVCQDELAFGYRNRPIFPILLRGTDLNDMPFWLPDRQWIDFTDWFDETRYQQQLNRLIQRIRKEQISVVSRVPTSEIRYLNTLISELEVEQGVENYVALRGQSEVIRQNPRIQKRVDPSMKILQKPQGQNTTLEQEVITDIQDAITKHNRFVLIGEPGAGKTTTIRRLVLEQARARLKWLQQSSDRSQEPPVPLLVYLPRWKISANITDFLRIQWEKQAELGGNILNELHEGRVVLYLDGLNEMGKDGVDKIISIKEWLDSEEKPKFVIVTCRKNDYKDELDLNLPVVSIEPLTEEQIRDFALKYLEDIAETNRFLSQIFPHRNLSEERALLHLAQVPYLLTTLLLIYENGGDLPRNTGILFKSLVEVLWRREELRHTSGWIPLNDMLKAFAQLAYDMIDTEQSLDVSQSYALGLLGNPDLLKVGRSAAFITIVEDQMRFNHQLILEYFAAEHLKANDLSIILQKPEFNSNMGFMFVKTRRENKWDNAIIALCGLVDDVETLLQEIVSLDAYLATECILSGLKLSEIIINKIAAVLFEELHQKGRKEDLILALGNLRVPFVKSGLVNALFSKNANVAIAAANALEVMRDPLTIPALLVVLTADPVKDHVLIYMASIALASIGRPSVPYLISVLHNSRYSDSARGLSAQALGIIKDSQAVPELIPALYYKSSEIRWRSADALGQIGHPASVIHLIHLLDDYSQTLPSKDEFVCDIAANALQKIGTPAALDIVQKWREFHGKE